MRAGGQLGGGAGVPFGRPDKGPASLAQLGAAAAAAAAADVDPCLVANGAVRHLDTGCIRGVVPRGLPHLDSDVETDRGAAAAMAVVAKWSQLKRRPDT